MALSDLETKNKEAIETEDESRDASDRLVETRRQNELRFDELEKFAPSFKIDATYLTTLPSSTSESPWIQGQVGRVGALNLLVRKFPYQV